MPPSKTLQFYILIIPVMVMINSLAGAQRSDPLHRLHLVTRDHGRLKAEQPHLIRGEHWIFTSEEIDTVHVPLHSPLRSVVYGDKIMFTYRGLYTGAVYKMRIWYLADKQQRIQNLLIDGQNVQENLELIPFKPMEFIVDVPGQVTRDGRIELVIEKVNGPNAVVSEIELWSDRPGLKPDLEIQACGDFRGTIEGTVQDKNNNSVLSGIDVILRADERVVTSTKTDHQGHFILKPAPEKTEDPLKIEIVAQNSEGTESLFLSGQEVFYQPVLFTSVPQNINGIKKSTLSLNSTWKFNPAPSPGFWETGADARWSGIEVPGEWVMQGFKVEPNTAAGYFRNFSLPSDWEDQRIILRCDAVYSDATVFINSNRVGQHTGGMTPFEFDITSWLKPGEENSIALAVKNESLEDTLGSITQYAAHPLGGITRKIFLFTVPEIHLANLYIETLFDLNFEHAVLKLKSVLVNDTGKEQKDIRIRIELNDPAGKPVPIQSLYPVPEISINEMKDFSIETQVNAPQKWESEHPNLYTLLVHLEQNGTFTETIRQKIGFRQIEVRGPQVLVNGQSVKLRGINRHEVHPVLGRSLNETLWLKDAELFRDANMNYIRTSHYPPAEEFISCCDSLGLFVELEAPFVWIGHAANATWQERTSRDRKILPAILRGISETIQHYYNHPSILIWSMANESAWNRNWEQAYRLTNILDPTRPKSFHDQAYGGYNNYGSTIMPVANMHYPGPDGPEQVKDFPRPLLFGEYCHLNTYNRQEIVTDPGVRDYYGVAIAPMWQKMHESKGCLGGAIWSGIDDVFELPDSRAVGYGEWGPIDGWRRKKPEYWHIKKTYSPIRLTDRKIELPVSGEPLQLEVVNWHDFTNLSELNIEWQIGEESGVVKTAIAPHEKGMIRMMPQKMPQVGQTLKIRFRSLRNFVIDSFDLPIGEVSMLIEEKDGESGPEVNYQILQDDHYLIIYGRDQEWVMDRKNGLFISGVLNGKAILNGGPHLMMLALVSGPCSTEHSRKISPFNDPCTNWQAFSVASEQKPAGISVTVHGAYDQAEGRYTYNFRKDGSLQIDYNFTSKTELEPRQVGLIFDINENCQILEWKRKAQWTSYPEDHIGRPEGMARAFPFGKMVTQDFRKEPEHAWAYDHHDLGCNDFRATRRTIYQVRLRTDEGDGVKVVSDGSQHARAFMQGGKSHLLIAGYDTGGADIFLASHYIKERAKIETGMPVQGSVLICLTGREHN